MLCTRARKGVVEGRIGESPRNVVKRGVAMVPQMKLKHFLVWAHVPLFGITANQRGTGKGTLVDLATIIAVKRHQETSSSGSRCPPGARPAGAATRQSPPTRPRRPNQPGPQPGSAGHRPPDRHRPASAQPIGPFVPGPALIGADMACRPASNPPHTAVDGRSAVGRLGVPLKRLPGSHQRRRSGPIRSSARPCSAPAPPGRPASRLSSAALAAQGPRATRPRHPGQFPARPPLG